VLRHLDAAMLEFIDVAGPPRPLARVASPRCRHIYIEPRPKAWQKLQTRHRSLAEWRIRRGPACAGRLMQAKARIALGGRALPWASDAR